MFLEDRIDAKRVELSELRVPSELLFSTVMKTFATLAAVAVLSTAVSADGRDGRKLPALCISPSLSRRGST